MQLDGRDHGTVADTGVEAGRVDDWALAERLAIAKMPVDKR